MVTRTKSLAREVAELRKLVEARVGNTGSPIYLRSGDVVPEGIAPERIVWIERTYVDAPERPEDELPAPTQETAPAGARQQRRERLEYPNFGLA
jgi:hypothetical protein